MNGVINILLLLACVHIQHLIKRQFMLKDLVKNLRSYCTGHTFQIHLQLHSKLISNGFS